VTDQTRDPMFGTLREQPREGVLSNRFRRGRRAREGRIQGSESKQRRPTEIKTAWNPRNLLRHNKKIVPANAGQLGT
jgi:hypothetical protein